jgi:hypothetical protein
MRTTITLDSDVEALLNKMMTERGLTFKEAVNGLLRSALARSTDGPVDFSFPTYEMGEPTVPLEHALRVAADLEDEEIIRKLSVGR